MRYASMIVAALVSFSVLSRSLTEHRAILEGKSLVSPTSKNEGSLTNSAATNVEEVLDRCAMRRETDASNVESLLAFARADDAAFDLLLQRLANPMARPTVLLALSKMPERCEPEIVRLLRHESPEVRWSTLNLLLTFDRDMNADSEVTLLLRDNDVMVRRCACMALARYPSPRARPTLVEAIQDTDPEVRWRSLWALYAMGMDDPQDASIFQAATLDPDSDVRHMATAILKLVN